MHSPLCTTAPDTMALIFTLSHVISLATATSAPKSLPAGSALHLTFGDSKGYGGDDISDAYINVTYRTENGWTWDQTQTGRFGGSFVGPTFGYLVHVTADSNADDHTGCQLPFRSTRSDRQLPRPGEPWVALIKRGRCNFELKVENAFRSNASSVLVYNDRDASSLERMKLSDNGRNISAIFTFKFKGEELAKLLENDSEVLVHITVASRSTVRNATINRTSVLFVSITFIVLMIISFAWLVFYYVQRFRYMHAKDRLSRRLGNAAKKALSKIPTKSIKSEDKEVQDGECCAICIEPYKISEVLRMLPCHHEFHKSCIDPWLLEHRTCPMCKMDILKHYGFVFTGSQESILHMEIEEVLGLGLSDSQESDSPRRGGVSPLPQIRAVIVSDHQRSYDGSMDLGDQSSRASTPDETTPSLPSRRLQPVRQDLCANCIAAAAASVLVNTSQGDMSRPKSHTDLENSDSYIEQVLIPEDEQKRVQVQESNRDLESSSPSAVH